MAQTMLINVEQKDLKHHSLFVNAKDVKELVAPLAQYGVTDLSYERIDADGGIVNLSSMPVIEEIFIQQKLYHHAFGATYDQYTAGYFLGDFCGLELDFTQALRAQNLWHILMVVQRHATHTEIISFATHTKHSGINHFYINNLDIFEKFILSFKEKAARLIRAYESERLLYPNGNDISILADKTLAKKFSICESLGNINYPLTKREQQCLQYLQQGYTAKMIAKRFDISHRTVEHHLAHIREKLDIHSIRQLLMNYT